MVETGLGRGGFGDEDDDLEAAGGEDQSQDPAALGSGHS